MPSWIMPLVIEVVLIGILSLLFWLIVLRVINRERAQRKSPFTKALLKGPGEGCMRKLEELGDSIAEWYTILLIGFGIVVGTSLGALIPGFKSPTAITIFAVLGLIGAIYIMVRIRRDIRERINYRLGFEGERHTAQSLQPLLANGYEFFHDLEFKDPAGKPFNIDHVLLGPAGIIVVETKARSKDAAGKGSAATAVRYDGEQIHYPKVSETHGLDQAIANAKHLSRELTSYTGKKTFVLAALSLPGWFVSQTAKDVNPVVHNPEMLRFWVQDLPISPMDIPQINRIRGFLEKASARLVD